MARSGISAQIGFAVESTYGVAATPTVFVPFVSESLRSERERIKSESIIAGRRTRTSEQVNEGNVMVSGDIQLELYPDDFLKLLKVAFGTVSTTGSDPYTHVFTPADTFSDSLTIQVGRPGVGGTVHPFTYVGCKIISWEIAGSQGEYVTVGISVLAKREIDHRQVTDGVTTSSDATVTSASAAFTSEDVGKPISGTGISAGTTIASVTSATSIELSAAATASGTGVTLDIGVPLASASITAQRPYHFIDAAVTAAGSTVKAKSFTISGAVALADDRRFLGTRYIDEPIENELMEFSGSVEAEFIDMTQYRRYTNFEEFDVSVAITSGADSVTITGNAYYIGETPQVSGRAIIPQNLPFEFVSDDDDAATMTVTVVNGQSTV